MSSVYNALGDLSKTVRQGFGNLASDRMARGRLGLERAQFENTMARQGLQDQRDAELFKLRKPGLELNAEKAQLELDKMNRPLTMAGLFNTPDTMEHAFWTKDGSEPLYSKVEKLLGGTVDTDEKSGTYGKFVRDDGSVITYRDAMAQAPQIQAMVFASTDVFRDARARKENLEMAIQRGEGDPRTLQAELQNVNRFLEDPKSQLAALQQQYDKVQSLAQSGLIPKEEIESNLSRIEKKMGRVQNQMNSDRDYGLKKDRFNFEKSKAGGKGKDPAMVKSAQFIFDIMRKMPANSGKDDNQLMMEAWDVASAKKEMSRPAFKRQLALEYSKQGYKAEDANKEASKLLRAIWPKVYNVDLPKTGGADRAGQWLSEKKKVRNYIKPWEAPKEGDYMPGKQWDIVFKNGKWERAD